MPSPWLRRAAWLLAICLALHVLELAIRGHLLAALLLSGMTAAAPAVRRWHHATAAAQPRRLLCSAGGRLHLLTVGGQVVPVECGASGMRIGACLLLSLLGGGKRYWLWFGPDNLTPRQLAMLRRRINAALPAVGSEVDSADPRPVRRLAKR